MNGDNEDQRRLEADIRAALLLHPSVSAPAKLGILRCEVAWLEVQITRRMHADLNKKATKP